jgi:tetratricopeptide (TPR) repeat protein
MMECASNDTASSVESYVNQAIMRSTKVGFSRNIEMANLYQSIGKFEEAVGYFETAHAELSKHKADSCWERIYFNTCLRYAWCLDFLGNVEKAEELFLEALPAGNSLSLFLLLPFSFLMALGGLALGDYASFLHRRKADYTLAQRYYKMALQALPTHSSIHLKYAGFLRHVHKDMAGAAKHYTLAVETNPNSSDALGNLASFLHGIQKTYDEAEVYYERAVKADTEHTNNYCNFGLFLSEERSNYEEAEALYKHALELNPMHANTLYNYAVMLDSHCGRKEEAEGLYRTYVRFV